MYQGWFGSIGSIFLAAAARIFRCYACVRFFYGVPTKKGLRWCLFLLYQPTSMNNRQIARWCLNVERRFLQNTLKISLKMLLFYTFFLLRSRVTTDAPSVYTTLLPGWPSHRKDPLPATFPRISASRLFKYVWSIQRQNVRNNSINGLTGVFLDRHG